MPIYDEMVNTVHEMEQIARLFNIEPFPIYFMGGSACLLGRYTEKAVGSYMFKQISDLLYFMACNKEKYPKFKAFLWTLESREIKGAYYGVTDMLTLEEQAKLVDMFLNLAYWKEIA